MTSQHVRYALTLCTSLCLTVSGCSDPGAPQIDPIVLFPDGGAPTGCVQPLFPEAEPNMLFPPVFTALQVQPGQDVVGEIVVDAETRKARIELSNAWYDVAPIDSLQVESTGDETIPFRFATTDGEQGRYYLRIELCGFDCNQQMVIFGLDPDVNANYERIAMERSLTVKAESTCIPPTSILVQ